MSCFHKPWSFIIFIMCNIRSTMKKPSNSMSCITLNNRKSIFLNIFRNKISNISIHSSWLTNSNRFFKCFVSLLNQEFTRLSHLPDIISLIQIYMMAFFINSDIQINYIPVLKWSIIRNSMANHLVYRSTKWFWEFVIIQRRWISIMIYYKLMNLFIYLLSCYTNLHQWMTVI